ncbi:hypothetical protein C8R46DRAFT_1314239 [Mycena filopes]|nr:hypothetical protein C8R46DRAFT_1314239 [Mycena filopes]
MVLAPRYPTSRAQKTENTANQWIEICALPHQISCGDPEIGVSRDGIVAAPPANANAENRISSRTRNRVAPCSLRPEETAPSRVPPLNRVETLRNAPNTAGNWGGLARVVPADSDAHGPSGRLGWLPGVTRGPDAVQTLSSSLLLLCAALLLLVLWIRPSGNNYSVSWTNRTLGGASHWAERFGSRTR